MARQGLILVLLVALLSGCATPAPFSIEGARLDLPAYQVVDEEVRGIEVIWGGMIVAVRDFGEGSEIEVLANPLDRRQRPITQAPTLGRFVIRVPERLDRFDAPEGRYLTVRGRILGSAEGQIGPSVYRYPILVDAQFVLWKQGFQFDERRWSLGVGIVR